MPFGLDKRCLTYLLGRSLFFVCLIVITGCRKPHNERRIFLCKWHLTFEDSLQFPGHCKDAAGNGTFYSRTNAKNEYSDGISFLIPDSLMGKNVRIKASCLFRRAAGHGDALLVAQVVQKDQNFFYHSFYISDYYPKENSWVKMEDSTQVNLLLPAPVSGNAVLKVYLWNQEPFNVDLDELEVELYRIESDEMQG